MWSPLLAPGKLVLIHGPRAELRRFHQELAHYAVHNRSGTVLWCDGEHGFNPYDFAELNLTRGHDADAGDERLLVKRCLTPFQWATVLNQHVQQKLVAVEASMVLAAPFDGLFSTDELKDWEQEHYVEYSVRNLRALAQKHRVPIVLSADMRNWWRTHPMLARMTQEGVDHRWAIRRSGAGWIAVEDEGHVTLGRGAVRQPTLWDYAPGPVLEMPLSPVPPNTRRTPSGSPRIP